MMRIRTSLRALLATAAVAGLAIAAAPAQAAAPVVSLSNFGDPDTLPAGQTLVADFNDAGDPAATLLPGFTLTLNGSTVGVCEGCAGYSGTLYNDATHYLTIPGGVSAELTALKAFSSFSLYMGSPDTYNSIRFIGEGYDETLSGGQLTAGIVNQSWDWAQRVTFDFGGAKVNRVILSSSQNSFEVDNLAVSGAVPEPATWAMMIMGFGLAGAAMRARRSGVLAA
jgi:hypothetical protein